MNLNTVSFLGHKINRIGFGCWQLAGPYQINGKPNGYGNIDQEDAVKAIHTAIDNGINFFDTAAGYGFGKSEEVLGTALKSYAGSNNLAIDICTKYGAQNDWALDFSQSNLTKHVEDSLKRLQADRISVLLLHNPPDDFNFSDLDTAPFENLIAAGKIGAYGVSCRTQKGVANVIHHSFGSVIEAVYNPLDRRFEEYFSNSSNSHYLFICRVPLASGFISPRTLKTDPVFEPNDIRSNFDHEQTAWVSGAVKRLAFLNELEGGISVSALRFQLSNPYNTITIPGIKSSRHLKDAVLAMKSGALPNDILNKISAAVPEVYYKWR